LGERLVCNQKARGSNPLTSTVIDLEYDMPGGSAMLVLSRKKGERIVIGKDGEIVLEIIEIRGDKVRLGVVAPKDVPVHREEVYEQVKGDK
jgi:carbon storage regulator